MLGASLEEAHLHEGEEDSRVGQRRIGDSDLDWGDGSDAVEELSTGIGAMDIDADIDVKAMESFVKGMSADGSRHMTMDDIADSEAMKAEDEYEPERGSESDENSSDEEVEAIVRAEEDILIGEVPAANGEEEAEDSDDDEDDEDDDEETPRRGFQARLEKIRRNAAGKKKATEADLSSDEEDDDSDAEMSLAEPWAAQDEDYIRHIEVGVCPSTPKL